MLPDYQLQRKIHLKGRWRPLFLADRLCSYVNDHTIFRDKSGRWRALGTCGNGPYYPLLEYFFIDCSSADLLIPMKEERRIFHRHLRKPVKISPAVFFDHKSQIYHLYFGHRDIAHYTSCDGVDWRREKRAIRSSWPFLRDPHIIEYADNYLMYITDIGNKITVFRSNNLTNWHRSGVALSLGEDIPKSVNSSCESPFVLKHQDAYLLFTTIVPSPFGRRANYLNTHVFISKDPLHFGCFARDQTNTANLIGRLEAHAPEIIHFKDKYYITTCGWKNFPKPRGVNREGIFFNNVSLQIIQI